MHLATTHDGECHCLSAALPEDHKEPACSKSPLSSIFSLKIGTCFCFVLSWDERPGGCFQIWTSIANCSSLAMLFIIQNPTEFAFCFQRLCLHWPLRRPLKITVALGGRLRICGAIVFLLIYSAVCLLVFMCLQIVIVCHHSWDHQHSDACFLYFICWAGVYLVLRMIHHQGRERWALWYMTRLSQHEITAAYYFAPDVFIFKGISLDLWRWHLWYVVSSDLTSKISRVWHLMAQIQNINGGREGLFSWS